MHIQERQSDKTRSESEAQSAIFGVFSFFGRLSHRSIRHIQLHSLEAKPDIEVMDV